MPLLGYYEGSNLVSLYGFQVFTIVLKSYYIQICKCYH